VYVLITVIYCRLLHGARPPLPGAPPWKFHSYITACLLVITHLPTMPVCEGRPNESCPKAAKGRGVVNCQGDLWLCRECEEFRFPSAKSANSGARTSGRKSTRSTSSQSEVNRHKASANSSHQSENTSKSNKGKESEMCTSCLQLFLNDDRHVECDICAQKLHLNCSGIPQEAQDFFHSYASKVGYVCSECRISMQQSFHQLQVAISVLTDELALLKTEIAQVKSSSSSSSTSSVWQSSTTFGANSNKPGTGTAAAASDVELSVPNFANDSATVTGNKIVSLIERTVRDTTRRKRNVIISGVPECTDTDDRASFLNICSEHLSVKPYLSVDSCIRIGKANLNQPRRLLVRLSSEDMASELLKSAKKLRNCDDSYVANSVYINQDLSPTEAKLAFERREKRRRQQSLLRSANVEQPVNTATSFITADTEYYEQSKSTTCISGHSILLSADSHSSASALSTVHSSSTDSTSTVKGSTSTAVSDSISGSCALQGCTVGAESGLDPTAQPFRSSH